MKIGYPFRFGYYPISEMNMNYPIVNKHIYKPINPNSLFSFVDLLQPFRLPVPEIEEHLIPIAI